jgi:hypothetical protein
MRTALTTVSRVDAIAHDGNEAWYTVDGLRPPEVIAAQNDILIPLVYR